MKTNKHNSLVTTITTIGLLSAGSFAAYAGGPNFDGFDITADNIQLNDTIPDIVFNDTAGEGFEIEVFNDIMRFQDRDTFNSYMTFHHSGSSIGFGVDATTPNAPFHFRPTSDGTDARILCDNKNQGTTTPRNMFHLRNNGAPRFVLEDSSLTGAVKSYAFAMSPQGNFILSRVGQPGADLTILANGDITMGPGTTTSFRVTNSGVQATRYSMLSDRNAKTDIEEVNSHEILDKLKQLPVSTWRFKSEEGEARHIGPMAQDFHETFGDGTDKNNTTINLGDMAGVALAGVKSLDEKIDARDEVIHALDQKINERDQKIEALESRLIRLEALLTDK